VLGEVFERHEAVIGFFGEPEHNSPVYQVYGQGKANSMRMRSGGANGAQPNRGAGSPLISDFDGEREVRG
jgi:hypothetical protein